MKKIKIIIFSVFAFSLLISCEEQMEIPSDGRITMDEVFTDYNRIRGYLNSCYGYCPAPYMDRASFTDEAQDADDDIAGSRYSNWYAGNITAVNFPANSVDGSPWGSLYEGIRKCNVFLENIGDATTTRASEEEKAGWVAQAHTLRALYYLQLIKRYGGVPLITSSFEVGADFSEIRRSSFADVVDFIIEDCDAALEAPDTRDGFHWAVYENQFEIMTRAVAYAIKSQAVTYAASPLWSDGTYTWDDATAITGEALSQCLANDYKLFDVEPDPTIAQNAYALFHFTSSNDQRAVDKETILQIGNQMEVWRYAGLPTNPGMVKAGPCPTQELIDSYEMANGMAPITGYSDGNHTQPVINTASGYDPENPYEGRDPRFYASIYYNGAIRNLGSVTEIRDDTYSLDLDLEGNINQLDIVDNGDGSYELTTGGGDPNVMTTALGETLDNPPSVVFAFEYKVEYPGAGMEIEPQLYFGPALAEPRSVHTDAVPESADWTTYSADITEAAASSNWGNDPGDNLRFDVGTNSGITIEIKNLRIEVKSGPAEEVDPSAVQTYVGGNEEISATNRKHTRTGYYLRKFNNFKSGENNQADGSIRLFRLAELYLNFAEAAYQSQGPDASVNIGNGMSMSARDAVNAVRERVGMPPFPAGMSAQAFGEKYRNERRVELAFEEHRFFDVRRWKILDDTGDLVTGMRITKNGDDYAYERFVVEDRNANTDKYLMYPVPQNEVNKMIDIAGVDWQNPGWQ